MVQTEGSARDRAGRYNGNGGYTPDGMRYVRPAEGVTRANPGGFGYVGVQDTADWFCCEDVYLTYSLDGRGRYLDFGRKGGCTAAFMDWGRRGRTLRGLTFRRCTTERIYHHGFSLNLVGAAEGDEFADVLFDQCHAVGRRLGPRREERRAGDPRLVLRLRHS